MSKSFAPTLLLKIATGRNIFLFFALFVAFAGFIMPSMEADVKALSGGVGVIDLEFYYSPAKALSMLSSYGPQGIHLYIIAQWTVDLVFPIIGGLFFATFLLWLNAGRWWWLGPLLTFSDWVENVLVTILLLQFPGFSPSIAVASCVFTCIKWSTIFFSNGMILFYGGKKLLTRYKVQTETI